MSLEHSSTPSPRPMNSPGESMKIHDPEVLAEKMNEYFEAVKEIFKNNHPKYFLFCTHFRKYKKGKITVRGLVLGVLQLLHQEIGLLLYLNHFLPEGVEFTLEPEGVVLVQPGKEPELLMNHPDRPNVHPMREGNTH